MIWNIYVHQRTQRGAIAYATGAERNRYYGCKVNVFFAFAQKNVYFFTKFLYDLTNFQLKRLFDI